LTDYMHIGGDKKMEIFVYDGWGKGDGKGTTFKGTPLDPTGEEYKIVQRVVNAFLRDWDIVGIWKNNYGSYLIQVKSDRKVGDTGNWDHYYAYIVIPSEGAVWISKGLKTFS